MRQRYAAVGAALVLMTTISSALAIDENEIESALRENKCPTAKIDDRGLPDLKPCKAYEPDYSREDKCQDEAIHYWNQVLKYNKLYEACHQNSNGQAQPNNAAKKPSGAELQKAVQAAKLKADEARSKALQAAAAAEKAKSAAEAEKQRLKDEAARLPSWCQGMVSSCEQRASTLSNSSQETQSQCRAYCRNLRIENCNGASPTIQQAAQACNSGARNDQKAETERQRSAKAQQAQREAEERRKWHCFGEAGNIDAGFRECQSECSAYFSASHCHDVCYASGDGSVSNGRSCYREP